MQSNVEDFFIPKKGIFNHNLSHKPSTGKSAATKDKCQERIRLRCDSGTGGGLQDSQDELPEVGAVPYHGRPHLTTLGSLRGSTQPPHSFQLHLGSHKVRTHNQPTYSAVSEASVWKGKNLQLLMSNLCYLDSITKSWSWAKGRPL